MLTRLTESKIAVRIRKSDIFETIKHSQNYFLAQIVTTGLAFISIPIFTRLFTQEDYGVVAVFNAYIAIAIIILSANSFTSVGRYYFEKESDFNEFLGTTLILTSIIFSISMVLFLLFYSQIASLMKLPDLVPILIIPASIFIIANSIYFQIIQPQRRSLESAVISILQGSFSLVLAIILVLLLKENRYLGKMWATLLVGFIFSLYYLVQIIRYSKLSFKKNHVYYILTYSIPLIPYALSGTILAYFDRIMINDAIGAAPAGIYSLGYNIAMLLAMVISATQTALMPDFFDFLNTKQFQRLDALVNKVFSIITLAALGLILFSKEIVLIMADVKFHEGLVVVPIVVVGYVFFGMFTVYIRYIDYMKKTYYSSLIMILSGIVNIVLNFTLIPQFGYIAAAYSTVVSYFLLFLMTWIVSKFILKQKLTPLWKIWKPTTLLFIYFSFYYLLSLVITDFFFQIFVKLIVLTIFFVTVFHREIKLLLFRTD